MKKVFILLISIFFLLLLQNGVYAARFEFSPSSATYISQCESKLSLYIDAQGESSNSADIIVNYDPAKVEIVDSNPNRSGVQILPGDAYEVYVGNQVDTSNGIIRLAGISFSQDLTSEALFATIEFKSLNGVTSAEFEIEYTGLGDTLDSNIAESSTSDDILTGVTNGSFSFSSGSCIPDTTPPNITFNYPQNNQTGVPLDTNFQIQITDSQSDIDLDSIVIYIADQEYRLSDPEVTYTGGGNSIVVTINPSSDLPDGRIIVGASAADIEGNSRVRSIYFNAPSITGPTGEPEPTPTPLPRCGEACSEDNPCRAGLSCIDNTCILNDCVGKSCTCNFVLRQCGEECIDDNDCQANLSCTEGLCRIPSCVDSPEDCACTPPILICEEQTPVGNAVDDFINNFTQNETLDNISDAVNNFYERFVPQPIQSLADEYSLPGVVTGFMSLGLLANIISFVLAFRSPQLLFLLFGLLFGKDRKPWGIVYDGKNNKPIPFASIRIYLKGTKTLVEQRITDNEGRYGLVLPAGKYRMEVEHVDFKKEELDVEISSDNDVVPIDVEMLPIKERARFSLDSILRSFNQFLIRHTVFFVYFGLLTSLLAILISQNVFNVVMLIIYSIAAILYTINRKRSFRRWGEVVDSKTGYRIPYAIVKLFDRDTWKVIDTQMTNQNGSFGIFNEPGKYAILVSAKGYVFPSTKQKDLKPIEDKFGLLELDIFDKKKLNLTLYLDPKSNASKFKDNADLKNQRLDKIEGGFAPLPKQPGNLASPFGE